MRKLFVVLLAGMLALSCGGNRKAHISGTFAGLSGDTVVLEMITTSERKAIDTAVLNDKGEFSFKVELPAASPTFYNIICHNSVIPLVVSPGEKVKVNSMSDLQRNYQVEGSPDSELLREFHSSFHAGVRRFDSLSYAYSSLPSSSQWDSRRDRLLREYTDEYVKFKRENILFIVTHSTSMASLFALYQNLPNNQSLFNISNDIGYYRMLYDSLSSRYPESRHLDALRRDIEVQNRVIELLSEVDSQGDNPHGYPDIEMNDMFGNTHRLYELDGQVILLDFWASDNEASAALNADLKEIYAAFAYRGFAVYQVSADVSRSEWVLTVQSQKLPWITVCDFKGGGSPAFMAYGIDTIPTNILIDRNGNIAGRNLYGEQLVAKLTELTRN